MINSTRSLFTTPVYYDSSNTDSEPTRRPSYFEKKILVYTKTYAKEENIPEKVSITKIETSKQHQALVRPIVVIWVTLTIFNFLVIGMSFINAFFIATLIMSLVLEWLSVPSTHFSLIKAAVIVNVIIIVALVVARQENSKGGK